MKVTVSNGLLFRDGVYTPPYLAERLLTLWRRTAADPTDWHAPFAEKLADELERGMRAAGYINKEAA